MHRLAHLLLTVWAGSLWTICGLVAPTLFVMLERPVAGMLAARFFSVVAWLGCGIGALLFVLSRSERWRQSRVVSSLIVVTAAAPVLSELVLGPLMAHARATGDMQYFALLHGLGGGLFLIACGGALLLIWKIKRAE